MERVPDIITCVTAMLVQDVWACPNKIEFLGDLSCYDSILIP
jgi:hypothetical protein